jgi:hypothetical protein
MSALLAANALAQDQPKEKTEPKEKTNVEEKGSCRDAIELPEGADQKAVEANQRDGCVVRGNLAVPLPEPGDGAAISVLNEDGSGEDLFVSRSEDGTALEVVEEIEPAPGPPSAAVIPACQDNRFTLRGTQIEGSIEWRYNRNTAEKVQQGNTSPLEAIKNAATNIENVDNSCNLPDAVDGDQFWYVGTTSQRADVFSENGVLACEPSDGVSVVSWGPIARGTLSAECTYTSGLTADGFRRTVESDIEINKANYAWTTKPNDCRGRYDLESVMTHERGHSAGLDHVGTFADSELTMVPSVSRCDRKLRTLGLGDVQGLEALYS